MDYLKLEQEAEARARIPKDARLWCILGPSGIGKSTLLRLLEELSVNILRSATTRPMRQAEKDTGSDYTHIEFHTMIQMYKAGQLCQASQNYGKSDRLEWNTKNVRGKALYTRKEDSGHLYGVTWSELADCLEGGDAVVAVTYDGYLQYQQILPGQVILTVLLPSSLDMLAERMLARGDKLENVEQRMAKVYEEMGYWREAHQVITVHPKMDPEQLCNKMLDTMENRLVVLTLLPGFYGSVLGHLIHALRCYAAEFRYLNNSKLLRTLLGGMWSRYTNVSDSDGGTGDWYVPIQQMLGPVGLKHRIAAGGELVAEGYI